MYLCLIVHDHKQRPLLFLKEKCAIVRGIGFNYIYNSVPCSTVTVLIDSYDAKQKQ